MPFRRIIRGKFWLSADFTMGKPALTQNNSRLHAFPRIIPRKGIPIRGKIRGKFWLSENYAPERHAFPRYNPWKVLTFRGLSAESQTSCTNISANSRKNIKQFLDVHQGPIRCWLMKKTRPKNLMLQSIYDLGICWRVWYEVNFFFLGKQWVKLGIQ
jgi:hypothetical protein